MAGSLLVLPLLLTQIAGEGSAPLPPDDVPASAPVDVEASPPDVDPEVIEGRRRPGLESDLPERAAQDNPGAVRSPPPEAFPTDQIPVPDRWRLVETLGLVGGEGLGRGAANRAGIVLRRPFRKIALKAGAAATFNDFGIDVGRARLRVNRRGSWHIVRRQRSAAFTGNLRQQQRQDEERASHHSPWQTFWSAEPKNGANGQLT